MKTIVLVRGNECKIYATDKHDAAGQTGDARHWFLRRIEKEGWEADSVYIADQVDKTLLEQWLEQDRKREFAAQKELDEKRERAEFERLKQKYGQPPDAAESDDE